MLKNRIIPILLIKHNLLVRSELFKIHQFIGKPEPQIERYNSWNVDELVLLDITPCDSTVDRPHENCHLIETLRNVSKQCFMPLTVGGGVKTISDIYQRLLNGADKVSINTQATLSPTFITDAAKEFGSQSVVISIDVKKTDATNYEVFSHGGKAGTGKSAIEWAMEVEDRGAGEILLNSIDRDGTGEGYDIALINSITEKVSIPVVCCGGVNDAKDLHRGLQYGKASAVAAGNFFHFKELSYPLTKSYLKMNGSHVR